MAKRANPHRRLLAKQMALRRTLVPAGNADDAGKLQEGAVRSPLSSNYLVPGNEDGAPSHRVMRSVTWEGRGKPGKVVRGQLQLVLPGTKSRFARK